MFEEAAGSDQSRNSFFLNDFDDFEKRQSELVCFTLSPVRNSQLLAAQMLQVHVLKMLATETNPDLLFLQKLLQLLGSKRHRKSLRSIANQVASRNFPTV